MMRTAQEDCPGRILESNSSLHLPLSVLRPDPLIPGPYYLPQPHGACACDLSPVRHESRRVSLTPHASCKGPSNAICSCLEVAPRAPTSVTRIFASVSPDFLRPTRCRSPSSESSVVASGREFVDTVMTDQLDRTVTTPDAHWY